MANNHLTTAAEAARDQFNLTVDRQSLAPKKGVSVVLPEINGVTLGNGGATNSVPNAITNDPLRTR